MKLPRAAAPQYGPIDPWARGARPHLKIRFLIAGLACLDVLARLPWFSAPFFRDEALLAYQGRLLLAGEPPYVAVCHQMGPLAYLLHALGLLMTPASEEGVRLLAALADAGTLACVAWLGVKLGGFQAGLGAGVCWLAASLDPHSESLLACTEPFMMTCVTAAVAAAVQWPERPHRAGLLLGAGLLIRSTALVFVLPLAWWLPYPRRLAILLLTALGPSLAVAALYSLGGHGQQWWDAMVVSSYFYAGSGPGNLGQVLATWVGQQAWLWALAAAGLALVMLTLTSRRDPRLLPLLCFLAGGLAVAVPRRYFGRNELQLLPWLTCLAGLGLAAGLRSSRPWLRGGARLAATAPLIVLLTLLPIYQSTPEEYAARYYGETYGRALGRRLAGRGGLYVWGNEWTLYFYSGRRAPTPYILQNHLLYAATSGARGRQAYADNFFRWQKESAEALVWQPPELIAVTAPLVNLGLPGYFLPGWLDGYLKERYVLLERQARFTLYRLKESGSGA